jgi:hypothetical protein
MKFHITLNVPTRGQMSHQIIGEHDAQSLKEFKAALQTEDFIIVEEWQPQGQGPIENKGELLINHQIVAKVRVFKSRQGN